MRSLSSSTPPSDHVSPFSRYFTPSPAHGSPAPARRSHHLELEDVSRDESVNDTRRASIDSGTSRASSHWATPPHHSRHSSPTSPLLSSSHSLPKVYVSPPDSYYDTYATGTSPNSPSTARDRIISRATPPVPHQGPQPYTKPSPPPVISIPPAQASDLTFDPAKKPHKKSTTVKSSSSHRKPHASPSRQCDANRRSPSPQPIKYRFVSVQKAQPSAARSTAKVARGGGARERVRMEEHMEEEKVEEGPFEHGPTEFPPRPYPGGVYATSPYRKKKEVGRISGIGIDFLPVLEARCSRLETAIDRYVDLRAEQALRNSILPGTLGYESSSRSSRR